MVKRSIFLALLISQILLLFSSCGFVRENRETKKLPELQYDDKGNVIYNENVYEKFDFMINTPHTPFRFKNPIKIARTEYWGFTTIVKGYGFDDFGEIVYIEENIDMPGGNSYIKSDFEFPILWDLTLDGIYIHSGYLSTSDDVEVYNFADDTVNLNQIVTEVVIDNYDNLVLKGYFCIAFKGYKNLRVDAQRLYLYNDILYIHIDGHGNYKINDEYNMYFLKAIEELEQQQK